tara:strand:- start:7908 stop:9293 length:1386 start_codon:yes stop_codon:yes gene_type:complete
MPKFRRDVGELEYQLTIHRNGQRIENEGNFNFKAFCKGFEIREDFGLATVEASFIFEDAAGIISILSGAEELRLKVGTSIIDRTFKFRIYRVHSRNRSGQTTDVFMVDCVSDEFMKNESESVFGNSDVLFKNKRTAGDMVETLVKGDKYLNSNKNLYIEDTVNKHSFVAVNWRPLDTLYWIAKRSIRKSKIGGGLQNGFTFFENALGYHFKSIDQLIDDINSQPRSEKTNFVTGVPKLHTYSLTPKSMTDEGLDAFSMTGLAFPEEKNILRSLRNGTWSGYTVGFDPVNITSSKMGLSKDTTTDSAKYNVEELWQKMSHLNGKMTVDPITQMDVSVQKQVLKPRRVRYTMLPNQVFDPKFVDNAQPNYQQLADLEAYQYMRIETLGNIQLRVNVPGNLDLYAGHGVDISIPATFRTGGKVQLDKKYSGRYLIQKVTHSTNSEATTFSTTLTLLKDSILRDK